jgi:hypothetical protein
MKFQPKPDVPDLLMEQVVQKDEDKISFVVSLKKGPSCLLYHYFPIDAAYSFDLVITNRKQEKSILTTRMLLPEETGQFMVLPIQFKRIFFRRRHSVPKSREKKHEGKNMICH